MASLVARAFRHLFHRLVKREAARLLPRRELPEAGDPLSDEGLRGNENKQSLGRPINPQRGVCGGVLEWIHAQIYEHRPAERHEGVHPHLEAGRALLQKEHLPIVVAQGREVTVVRPVNELVTRRFVDFAFEERHQVVAVEVNLEGLVSGLHPFQELLFDVRIAGGRQHCREHVLVRADLVDDRAGFDDAGPSDRGRHAIAAFPAGVFLTAEGCRAAVGPGEGLRAVVGGVHDDGVVLNAQFLELREQLADVTVVLDHAVGLDSKPGLALGFLFQMGEDVHAGRVEPDEERLSRLRIFVHETHCRVEELLVHGFHALQGQVAGVFALLLAHLAESRIHGGIVLVGSEAVEYATRTEALLERRILRVVGVLRLLLRVQVIKIAEELVEAVNRRDKLIAIAEVVFSELAGRVALRLEQLGERRVFLLQPFLRARQADLGQPGADGRLPGDECRAAGGAALLAIPVGEERAFLGDAVDVRRLVAHHALVVGADVP